MVRTAERLSARMVQTATAIPSKSRMLADGKGLYLRIGPTGSKSWIYRYQDDGKQHDLGLGPYPDISLAAARERATAQRRLRLDGQDPVATRRAGRDRAKLAVARAMTFRQCAEAYIAANRAGWREGSRSEHYWVATLEAYAYPVFGDLPVQMVDTALVTKAVEPLWANKVETASRVRGRIEKVLDWATVRGYRQGENPARWRGHLENLLPKKGKVASTKHHAALPYAEIGAFMVDLRRQEGVAARALDFAILTGARRGEVIGARWSEFNLAERIWTIPAARMKADAEHRVALSGAAVAIVEQMSRDGDLVFPSLKDGKPLLAVLARMKRVDLTMHGFRSTFADWAAEQTAFSTEVVELALAHKVGSKVEQAYRRTDQFQKRRQLADAWARYCSGPKADAGKVVAIRR
jgi:integrase